MSKAKTNVITIDQFNAALADIKRHGTEAKASIKTAVYYVMQCDTYKAQQAAIKEVGAAYSTLRKAIGDDISPESAARWVKRTAKTYNEKFQTLRSDTKAAAKKRAARQSTGEGKADTKKAGSKPAAKPETSIEQYRAALIEKERKLNMEYRNLIPAGKLEAFDQAFAAFISTIEMILK